MYHFSESQDLNDYSLFWRDSLGKELNVSDEESEHLELLRQNALSFSYINIDSTIYHGQKFLDASEKYKDRNRQLDALGIIGEAYIFKGDLPKALELSESLS